MPVTEAGTRPRRRPCRERPDPPVRAEEPLAGEVAIDPATGRPAGRAQAAGPAAVQLPGRPRRRAARPGAAPHPGRLRRHPRRRGADADRADRAGAGDRPDRDDRRPDRRPGRPQAAAGRRARRLRRSSAPRRSGCPRCQLIVASRVLRRAHRGGDHDLLHDAAGRLLPRLPARAATSACRSSSPPSPRRSSSAVGGALGAADWRAPFWLYVVSLPLAVAARPRDLAAGPARTRQDRSCRRCRGASSAHRRRRRCWAGWSSTS